MRKIENKNEGIQLEVEYDQAITTDNIEDEMYEE